MSSYELFIIGGLGALVRDVLQDNKLVLPSFKDGCFLLGFLGAVIIGGAAGYVADNNPMTAFLGGFTGYSLLANLIPKQIKK
jgi:fluoride ion exporter CrcB/FEX